MFVKMFSLRASDATAVMTVRLATETTNAVFIQQNQRVFGSFRGGFGHGVSEAGNVLVGKRNLPGLQPGLGMTGEFDPGAGGGRGERAGALALQIALQHLIKARPGGRRLGGKLSHA